ncbi:unnamed protein product [Oncorhynchus mykiss]|uniref:Uncharacterized protein n=1 Tax=Oncorhynchus mykiss TaxID=8022 RepID=A0A060XVM6_ONCMY|nr:unnamed protein product [Oncorhynchus mykiss]
MCFRCGTTESTFCHSTWQFTKLQAFWHDVCDTLTFIIEVLFPLDPEICLLGNFTNVNLRNNYQHKMYRNHPCHCKKMC